jgi:VIT1/CCC1 family predicted Fe2+/Mn2+ transporter
MDPPANPPDSSKRLLDPVDRISEILFGLIMAVTFVGALSVATAGQAEVHEALSAALGCNLAWGLVDAVMYVIRTATGRARARTLARAVLASDAAQARRLMRDALPEGLSPLLHDADLDGLRQRLAVTPIGRSPLLRVRDFVEAVAIFAWVVLATFPVVVPFIVFDALPTAMQAARIVTLVMLFGAGIAFGRVAGYKKPLHTGLAMALFGALLIAAVMALGG